MTPTIEQSLHVEAATAEHLAEFLKLVQATSDAPSWTEDAWASFVVQAQAAVQRSVLLLARSAGGTICGWIAGTVLAEMAELETVLVQAPYRGRGLGSYLIRRWLSWAAAQGATEALLEVRASNAEARALYRGLGFQEQGIRRDYYHAPVEDAVLMGLTRGDKGWREDLDEADSRR